MKCIKNTFVGTCAVLVKVMLRNTTGIGFFRMPFQLLEIGILFLLKFRYCTVTLKAAVISVSPPASANPVFGFLGS
mgnify:CR=1 FL=1